MKMTIQKNKKNTTSRKPVKSSKKYSEAKEYIQSAISALGEDAQKSDVLAKESIANLSVVLMDLN